MLIYAPLNFSYDKDKIRRELEAIPSSLKTDDVFPWKTENFDTAANGGWYLGSQELNENISRWHFVNGEKKIVRGPSKVTSTVIATGVPEDQDSSKYTFKIQNGKIVKFHMLYQRNWDWRNDLNIPSIIETAKRLPFEYIQLVRLVFTEAGSFCPVHLDESPKDDYYSKGFGKINLNILSGGQALQIKVGDRIYNADADVFFLNSSFPHGVAPVSSRRLQIQISGKLKPDWHCQVSM